MRGVNMLTSNGIKTRFKAMALKSNVHELTMIKEFCQKATKDYFRFDPFLHLRFDRNVKRNEDIISERLTPEEIVRIERNDPGRMESLEKSCDKLVRPEFSHFKRRHLFRCGAGTGNFTVGYDGTFRLCSSLWHPECVVDLRRISLKEAYKRFIPEVRLKQSQRKEYLDKCARCPIVNLCMWCPAHSCLETGEMDTPVEYFCAVAHARAEVLKKKVAYGN